MSVAWAKLTKKLRWEERRIKITMKKKSKKNTKKGKEEDRKKEE